MLIIYPYDTTRIEFYYQLFKILFMKMPEFILDYSRIVNNDAALAELKELAKEYQQKLNAINKSATGRSVTATDTTELRRLHLETYSAKARNIAKNSIDDKAAFEEIVWKHKAEFNKPDHSTTSRR